MTTGELKALLGTDDTVAVNHLDAKARIAIGEALDLPDAAAQLRASETQPNG